MKKIIFLFLSIVILTSCKSDKEQELDQQLAQFDQLNEETMEVHDVLMEDLGTLMDLSSRIDEQLESTSLDPVTVEELIVAKTGVDQAHDDMMDWMKDYSTSFPYEAEAPATMEELSSKMPIIQELKASILQIQEETEQAIAEAEGILSRA